MFTHAARSDAAKVAAPRQTRPEQEVEQEKLQKVRKKHLRIVEDTGTKPTEPSNFFLSQNKDFYNVRSTQVISCRMKPGVLDPELGNRRRTDAKRLFWINCGHPTAENQDAGKTLMGSWQTENGVLTCKDWGFDLLPTERFECTYTDPMAAPSGSKTKAGGEAAKVPDPKRVPDPAKDYLLGNTPMYSSADVAGRFVGLKALMGPGTTAWTTYVLGCDIDYATGKAITAYPPNEDTTAENAALYEKQRDALCRALAKIYLVYPYAVDGCFGPNGEPYALGELQKAKEENREPQPCPRAIEDDDDGKWAPQPVQFVSIASDKREGSPAQNIAGFHDTTRGWPLPPGHVERLRKILAHYGLEKEFPALANLHPKRNSAMLDLDFHRHFQTKYVIGGPPERPCNKDEPVSEAWLKKRSEMPFGKVWVQKCDPQHPQGHVIHGTNTPLLVPLRKNRAEDRNGTPWLDVEKIDRTTPEGEQHYVQVQITLHRVVGKVWNRGCQTASSSSSSSSSSSGKRKLALVARDKNDNDAEDPMLASLNRATADANRLRRENEHLKTVLGDTQAALKKARVKTPHMVLNGPGERRVLVDFVNGRDAKCILRWDGGNAQIDFGDGSSHKPIITDDDAHSIVVRFQPNIEQNLPEFGLVDEDEKEEAHMAPIDCEDDPHGI
jgi:hypothetical protein